MLKSQFYLGKTMGYEKSSNFSKKRLRKLEKQNSIKNAKQRICFLTFFSFFHSRTLPGFQCFAKSDNFSFQIEHLICGDDGVGTSYDAAIWR